MEGNRCRLPYFYHSKCHRNGKDVEKTKEVLQ